MIERHDPGSTIRDLREGSCADEPFTPAGASCSSQNTSDATGALKQLTYLSAALKTPRITEATARLADHARDAGWTHEEYLAAVFDREVAARNASGAQLRIRAAGLPALKTLEEFDSTAQQPSDPRSPHWPPAGS